MGFFSELKNYLFNKQESAIDVISLTVIGGIILILLPKLFKLIFKLVKKIVIILKETFRKYIKQQMNVSEYIDIQERLDKGGKLKWFEHKGYAKYKLEEESLQKKSKPMIASVDIDKKLKKMYRRKTF
ncbi:MULTISPECIES: hypothetical protein [Metabacillus]|uniref:hypothetical protein n=1 Tax=Metabacillus TaxID=2675233 RepID=UPI000C806B22|nr:MULTISPECIES: hypothetical protein [Metabacillus]MCM3443585.1 hypothetical protein [Metabacillus halosaccharovorans]PMC34254.1 hypothetical protein CJ195_24365 [Bacillus sp. UMB0899]